MIEYAIYDRPTWATTQFPYVLVEWLASQDQSGQISPQSFVLGSYWTLDGAREAIPDFGKKARLAPAGDDDPSLVELFV